MTQPYGYGYGAFGGGAAVVSQDEYRPHANPATDAYVSLDDWAAPAIDDDGTVWIATNVDGWGGGVDIRGSLTDRPQDHGSFDGPNFYGTRVITIEGTAQSPTRAGAMKAKDIIASVAARKPSALYELVVVEPGRPPRRANVRLSGPTKVSPVYGGESFDWSLQLVSPDPRRYAVSETVVELALSGDSGGITFPLTAPFMSTDVVNSRKVALNVGTSQTRPVAVFYGPLVDPQIANVTTGRTLSLTYTLDAGSTLICDFDARSILLDGTASRTYALKPGAAWWDLEPGPNDIAFAAAGGTGNAELRFSSAWH